MKKPSISEFSGDCVKIGVAMRRACFANDQLPSDEVHKARTEREEALRNFANKYGMPIETARTFAEVISDSVALGVAY
jgi:hypothetical protein